MDRLQEYKRWYSFYNTVKALYSLWKRLKGVNAMARDKPLAADSDSESCSVFSSPLDSSTSATVVNSGSLL